MNFKSDIGVSSKRQRIMFNYILKYLREACDSSTPLFTVLKVFKGKILKNLISYCYKNHNIEN